MRRILLCLMLAAAIGAPAIAPTAEAADATVTLADRATPATLSVGPGTRVTFANQSGERRRVRSEDGPAEFDSGNLEPGASWSVVLDVAGTYPYVDDRDRGDAAYHGTITVGSTVGPAPATGGGGANAGAPVVAPASLASVAILDRSFSPATVTVAPGGTVSWANQSDRDHTVTGAGFDSGVLVGGGRFSHTFPSAGTFSYVCDIHPEMQASVTVTAGAGAPEPASPPAAPATQAPPPGPAPATPTPQPPPPPTAGTAAAVRHDVAVVDYAFRPATVAARVGDTVVWTNQGRAPHTATAAGVFDTGMFRAGEQRTTTLRTAGTFPFGCTIHPEMSGVLMVAAGGGPAAPTPATGGAPHVPPATATNSPSTPGTMAPAAPADTTPSASPAQVVSVVDFAFDPAAVRLPAGGTVTWRLDGSAPHTASAVDSSFDSGILEPAATFSHRFDEPGTYRYVCALHPQMAGTVEVVAAPSPAGGTGEQAATRLTGTRPEAPSGNGSLLAGLLGGAALLAGAGGFLYGGSRMMAAGER